MDQIFETSDKIGDIVSDFPKASDVFKKYNIDYCCGGNRTLSAVLENSNINENELMKDLNEASKETQELAEKVVDWKTASLSELVDHIINTHHRYLENTLPMLSEITLKVLHAHGINHKEIFRVHKLFNTLKTDLEQHLVVEEKLYFPFIKEYEKTENRDALNKAVKVIQQLESEHETAGNILKELRDITKHYSLPDDACPTYERTYNTLEDLESDIFRHVHLENNVLHPRLIKKL
ncbi:MAG: iron-sulfur cluster repair di-iron protein [Firmicutes bacterium]|nr:iron-sulfur cluster repair di-iron protein [Bacillota bacterium]